MDLTKSILDHRKFVEDLSVKLNWYDHYSFKRTGGDSPLKKLISKRVEMSYKENNSGKTAANQDFWKILFHGWQEEDPFKAIVDNTLYRPRDMISIFNCIKKANGEDRKISPQMFKNSLREFSSYTIDEWKFELKIYFNRTDVENLFKFLENRKYQKIRVITDRDELVKALPNHDPADIMEILYNHSLIQIVDQEGRIYCRHREEIGSPSVFDLDSSFETHPCFKHVGMRRS